MEINTRLSQGCNGLSVSIHIDDLDITKLALLTERDIKEAVRPLIESYFRIEQGSAQAEKISNSFCYGVQQPQSACEECSRSQWDSGNGDIALLHRQEADTQTRK